MLGLVAGPSSAGTAPPGSCADHVSASRTQKAQTCVYFEDRGSYSYRVTGNIAGYKGIGRSKLTINEVGKEKCYYKSRGACDWQVVGSTNPSYPKSSTSGWVQYSTQDYARPYGTDVGCEVVRAFISWTIKFSSGGSLGGRTYTGAWNGSCIG
jgi:hypothetical protein